MQWFTTFLKTCQLMPDVKNPRHQMKVKVNICDRLSVISEFVRQTFLQFFGIMHVKDHIHSVVIYNIIKKTYFVECREWIINYLFVDACIQLSKITKYLASISVCQFYFYNNYSSIKQAIALEVINGNISLWDMTIGMELQNCLRSHNLVTNLASSVAELVWAFSSRIFFVYWEKCLTWQF